ncbi:MULTISPECIES: hypothetical protein [Kaistia]|uniref:Uncharacterized protein n=1 Tax=Kaistia nematophila TaxID=2994654 RepID=A0A9X3E4J6_9HYPH|nr:hypothetical protein [Kaistia nematophila]MCX5569578.1 hypothetical protein [Kaistia nematophila]
MGPAAEIVDAEQHALDERVDRLLAAHNGDARAVIETLLLTADSRATRISFGYVRRRLTTAWRDPDGAI